MQNLKIKRLNIESIIKERLKKHKLHTVKDVLSIHRYQLIKMLALSNRKTEELIRTISKACLYSPRSAYEIYEAKKIQPSNGFLPTNLYSLDLVLQGGICLGSVTEIAGPSGVGKTQFCFLLSVLTTLPTSMDGLDGEVIYIDTESTFKAERVKQIAESRFPSFDASEICKILERINVHQATTSKALKQIISDLEREIIKKKAKLIIVDSLASLMRKEFGTETMSSIMEKTNTIIQLSAILKDMAETFKIAVFVTNQITTRFTRKHAESVKNLSDVEDEEMENPSCAPPAAVPRQGRGDHAIIPALGLAWAHCVNTRLVAEYRGPKLRQLSVVKSPLAPSASVGYTVEKCGPCFTDEDIRLAKVTNPDLHSIRTRYNFLKVGKGPL